MLITHLEKAEQSHLIKLVNWLLWQPLFGLERHHQGSRASFTQAGDDKRGEKRHHFLCHFPSCFVHQLIGR